jgi:drug/metabolite transporter (DMT)-like permease
MPTLGFARLVLYLGVLAVTPDALMLRIIRESGASTVVVLLWRYLLSSFFLTLTAAWLQGGFGKLSAQMRAAPYQSMCRTAALQSLTNMGFASSLILVEPARALILISLAPFWAVLLSASLLGETVDMQTMCALVSGFGAVVLVFTPALSGLNRDRAVNGRAQKHHGLASPLDALPAVTGVIMAAYIVSTRHLTKRHPSASGPMIPALGTTISLVTTAAFGVWMGEPTLLPPRTTSNIIVIALNGVAVAIYYIGITHAVKEVPAAEAAVVLLLETVLAPVWMFAWYGDVPSNFTLAGGALLVGTLAVNEVAAAHRAQGMAGKERVSADLSASGGNLTERTPCLHAHASSSGPGLP